MTATMIVDACMEIGAEGRAGAGPGTRPRLAATVFMPSKGQGASQLSAAAETSETSVSGAESLRFRWQAVLHASGLGTGAGSVTEQGTAVRQRLGTALGTELGTEPGTEVDAGSTNEKVDAAEGIGAVQETPLPHLSHRRVTADIPNAASATSQESGTAEQTNTLAGVNQATPPLLQHGASALTTAVATQVQSSAATQNSSATAGSHAGRSAKSERRESATQRANEKPQTAVISEGLLAMPAQLAANAVMPASAVQAETLAVNLLASPQSTVADSALNTNRVPDRGKGTATELATTVRDDAVGAAQIKVQAGVNSRVVAEISAAAIPGRPEGSETREVSAAAIPGRPEGREAREVQTFAVGDAVVFEAEQQAELPRSTSTHVEAPQLQPASGEHRTEPTSDEQRTGSGNPPADATRATDGTHREANVGASGSGASATQSVAAASTLEKSNLDSAGQPQEGAASRLAHRGNAGDAAQPAVHAVSVQQSVAGVEAPSAVRIPAGAEGTANAMTAHAGVAAATATGTTAGDTFSAIDAGMQVETPHLIHAGGQTAEAGFHDPALGWVGVRADLSRGSVHAALIPGSTDAAQALSGHLAGLNAYLAEQHTPVATLTLASAGGGEAETSAGAGMQQGTGQNAEQNAPTQSQWSSQPDKAATSASAAQGAGTANSGLQTVSYTGEMRGGHISVIA